MEIMVVLVVISVLVGLLFPAVLKAREKARINRAQSEVFELQKAWKIFSINYPNAPLASYGSMDAATTQVLAGGSGGGVNSNGIAFMEFNQEQLEDGFEDPWGRIYLLGLQSSRLTTEWSFQSRVQCINAQRYKY
jgi:hypothetical protein